LDEDTRHCSGIEWVLEWFRGTGLSAMSTNEVKPTCMDRRRFVKQQIKKIERRAKRLERGSGEGRDARQSRADSTIYRHLLA
jgi:hypothetical protein